MKKKRFLSTSLSTKSSITGLLFVSPFIIGFILFFLIPFLQSLLFSFSLVKLEVGGYVTQFIGFDNYVEVLFNDPLFIPAFVSSIQGIVYEVPIIVILSLLLAVLVNRKFHGRVVIRSILFLPVIIASGVVIEYLRYDPVAQTLSGAGVVVSETGGGELFSLSSLFVSLINMGVPEAVVDKLLEAISSIFESVWFCGVQTLLCLAGLQTIAPSVYEAAKIEGADAWEVFWLITVPMMKPILFLTFVYSVIEMFTYAGNEIMKLASSASMTSRYGEASAITWLYLLSVLIILGVIGAIANRQKNKV